MVCLAGWPGSSTLPPTTYKGLQRAALFLLGVRVCLGTFSQRLGIAFPLTNKNAPSGLQWPVKAIYRRPYVLAYKQI
jgi:hypothetical protein